MKIVRLESEIDFEGFRQAARAAASRGLGADAIRFVTETRRERTTFSRSRRRPSPRRQARRCACLPVFFDLADLVCRHKEPTRYDLLYAALLRLRETPRFLEIASDPLVRRLEDMERAVRRDRHKMTAFVRFREIDAPDGARFVAWFEPEHYIEELTAPFFVDRFASMRFAILTPRTSILWDGTLRFGPGARREDAPPLDDFAGAWDVYYRSIFNPARLMKRAMLRRCQRNIGPICPKRGRSRRCRRPLDLAKRRWLPRRRSKWPLEPSRIAARFAEARRPREPADAYEALLREAKACRLCSLADCATQIVFGEGPRQARAIFVGEQPGDQEDLQGRPFVGPAGCCCARLYARPASQRASATSRMRSSISSSCRVENDASTRRRARARSITAAGGWSGNSPWWNRRSSLRSARARFALWRDRRRGWLTCGDDLSPSARGRCCRRSIPPICFDCQTRPQKRRRPAPSPTTSSRQLSSPEGEQENDGRSRLSSGQRLSGQVLATALAARARDPRRSYKTSKVY